MGETAIPCFSNLLQTEHQAAAHLAEVCPMRTTNSGGPHTGMEPVEPTVLDSGTGPSSSFLDSSASNISSAEALMLEGSTPSALDRSPDLSSEVDPPWEILGQLEPPEPPELEPQAADPAATNAEFPPAELVPAPTAAPSTPLVSLQDPASGIPSQPDAELELLVAAQQKSALEFNQQIEHQAAAHLAEVCPLSTTHSGGPHTGMEPVEPTFLDSGTGPSSSFLDSSASNISSAEALMLEGSTPSALDRSPDLSSEVDPPWEILGQLEPPEPPELELQAADPAATNAEFPPAELVPAPTAAPSTPLVSLQDPASGIPSQPDAELDLLAAAQQKSALEFIQQVKTPEKCDPAPSTILLQVETKSGAVLCLFSVGLERDGVVRPSDSSGTAADRG
nr:uncharacterized protein KIAA1211-like [Cavia porcellus]